MDGISPELFAQHSPAQWAEWLSKRPGSEEIRLVFKRPDSDDLTSPIGSYQFQNMVQKGFIAIGIADSDLERQVSEGRISNPLDIFPRRSSSPTVV